MIGRKRTGVLVVALAIASAVEAASLSRGPYLGRPDDLSVAVIWRTDTASDSRVDYKLADETSWATVGQAESTTKHTIRIDGLLPGAEYRYQVYADGVPLGPEGEFRAPRDGSQSDFVFAVIGDTNARTVPEVIAPRLAAAHPDFAIHTGDVVYPDGSDDLYDDEFFKPLAVFVRQAPVLPTLGNHDVRTNGGEPLLTNFVLPRSGTSAGSRFYAFRQANALFVNLDVETSSFGKGSLQYQWLIRTLSESDATWKFVYFHEPPYSSDHSDALIRIVLSPLFERYGVDVVFCGHAHLYERTFPICDFGWAGCRGVVYITEGGAGAGLSQFHRQKFSAVVVATHGYMIGSISGSRLTMTRYDAEGSIVDSFVVEKDRH